MLDPAKFRDPRVTAKGEARASVRLEKLTTLWLNTGTLCNIACKGCYIESSPTNDRLVYLTKEDVGSFFDEIDPSVEIGFTGGEPFMNPHIIDLIGMALDLGHRVLVLTNAMRPMMRQRVMEGLLHLRREHGDRLVLRVSLDHPEALLHDAERGAGSFDETISGIDWLMANGFTVHIAGRLWGADEAALRQRFGALLTELGWPIDEKAAPELMLFPEMDETVDVPEITTACWGILNVDPQQQMCASSRMVIKRAGASRPAVVACTLLPYDLRFELGPTLAESAAEVALNHPHCARFCVLGGGKCAA
ncbi:MAG: radical SAM protein [Alphaproteobacteria bacterium]|nr:radical SAM protein [Alphaproteobacteria bacterium]